MRKTHLKIGSRPLHQGRIHEVVALEGRFARMGCGITLFGSRCQRTPYDLLCPECFPGLAEAVPGGVQSPRNHGGG